ncbi:MAG TPA: type II toxin-antitoxin system RelE/ParE family toxin [Puia sp.]|nr:type II toxin-antitoxin system RelE/ParE family toxin [Puia sp.]
MVKREVTILDAAVEAVANIALFIEGKGLPETAKRFVDEVFSFFHQLADEQIVHRPCRYAPWRKLTYRCATFRKKYLVAYLELGSEVIVCEFALAKLLVQS